MTLNLIDKKIGIKNILSFKNSFVLSDLNDVIYFDEKVLLKNVDGSSLYKIKQEILQIYDDEKGCYYFKDNIIKSDFFLRNGFQNNICYAESASRRISRGYYKRDIVKLNGDLQTNNEVILEDTDYNLLTYSDKILIVGNSQQILSYNVSASEFNWHFDIQSIPNNPYDDNYDKGADWEVKKFIGVLENKIWIALNHHTIIALDVETGKLVHQLHDISGFKSGWLPSAIPLPEATVIDEKNNKLIGFMWEFYWEINPQTGEIILMDFTEEFLSQKIRNDLASFVLTDSHIYFASHHDIKVAAFNRASKQIDWFYEFEDDGNGYQSRISKIDGNDEKLGVLTQGKVLYIFEKE